MLTRTALLPWLPRPLLPPLPEEYDWPRPLLLPPLPLPLPAFPHWSITGRAPLLVLGGRFSSPRSARQAYHRHHQHHRHHHHHHHHHPRHHHREYHHDRPAMGNKPGPEERMHLRDVKSSGVWLHGRTVTGVRAKKTTQACSGRKEGHSFCSHPCLGPHVLKATSLTWTRSARLLVTLTRCLTLSSSNSSLSRL